MLAEVRYSHLKTGRKEMSIKGKKNKREILPLRCPSIKKTQELQILQLPQQTGRRNMIHRVCGTVPQCFCFLLTRTDKYKSRTHPSATGSACTFNILHQQRMLSILLRKRNPL